MPVLSQHDGVDGGRALERFDVLDQDAGPRRRAGAGDERRGRRQPEGAGAGNHQHGYGGDERLLESMPAGKPAQKRAERDRGDGRNEDGGNAVDQPLHRRFAGLRVFDHADDAGERRILPDRDRLDDEAANAVQRPCGDVIALAFDDRQALAGHERLVGFAFA